MSDTKVAVCGAPRSGNRLIARMLERHGFVAEVRHYGMRKAFRNGGEGCDCVVIPLRELEHHWRSFSRDMAMVPKPDWVGTREEVHAAHYWAALRYAVEYGAPVLPVSYEKIVADHEFQGMGIVTWCRQQSGITTGGWQGWGTEIVDGNAKWRERAVRAGAVGTNETCPRCGRVGHYEKDCLAPVDIRGSGRSA